jgi:urease alpha subunit
VQHFGLKKRIITVKGLRALGKKDMIFNDWCKKVRVDPDSFKVFVPIYNPVTDKEEEVEVTCEAAKTLPLTKRYFFF